MLAAWPDFLGLEVYFLQVSASSNSVGILAYGICASLVLMLETAVQKYHFSSTWEHKIRASG
jgi:hypothetical protein